MRYIWCLRRPSWKFLCYNKSQSETKNHRIYARKYILVLTMYETLLSGLLNLGTIFGVLLPYICSIIVAVPPQLPMYLKLLYPTSRTIRLSSQCADLVHLFSLYFFSFCTKLPNLHRVWTKPDVFGSHTGVLGLMNFGLGKLWQNCVLSDLVY